MRFFRHLLGFAAAVPLSAALAQEVPYDLVLRNARIVDGTGAPWYRGDIAIRGDTIARIAPSIAAPARRVVDLKDAAAAPGFIDVHTHAGRGIFQVPTADNYIRQGVTTVMEGVDGGGSSIAGGTPVPLKGYLARIEAFPKSINFATFIGQGVVREAVVGLADRKATPEEIDWMRLIVRESMRDGAFGMSTGLFYVPGAFTPKEEVIALQREVAPYRGVHMSHMRDEASKVIESVKETIEIGELGGVPTHVSHHKIIGKANWGKSVETLRLIDEARARGIDVTLDVYPYTASATTIHSALLPKWMLDGGPGKTRERIADPAQREKAKAEIAQLIREERGGGDPANVQIAACSWDPSLAGKNLAQIAREKGMEPTVANAADVVLWLVERGGCRGIFHAIGAEDIDRIIAHPASMIASDGEIALFGVAAPHPRSYGTFARVLGVYVRERRLLTLEDAVRKMTSAPAARIGLADRGILRAGMKADIAVFDPATVKDLATYDKPHQYAEGFRLVIVNGAVVFEDGAMTAARPGRVLYGPGRS
jgi:dihydroorotase/N-acyl-D-amino-acid deacylase